MCFLLSHVQRHLKFVCSSLCDADVGLSARLAFFIFPTVRENKTCLSIGNEVSEEKPTASFWRRDRALWGADFPS